MALVGCLMAATVIASATSSAIADSNMGIGEQLKPLTSADVSSGSVQATSSEPADGTLFCSVRYATVSAKPSGFAIGNCPYGTHVHRQKKSTTQTGTYDGGMIFGRFAACGWIRNDQRNGFNFADHWADCVYDSIGYNDDEFIFQTSPGTYWYDGCRVAKAGDPECKGTQIVNRAVCVELANVRPWAGGYTWTVDDIIKEPNGAYRMLPANATYGGTARFAWRYVTKYPTTDGNYWVMGRDRAAQEGDATWVFVPLACL